MSCDKKTRYIVTGLLVVFFILGLLVGPKYKMPFTTEELFWGTIIVITLAFVGFWLLIVIFRLFPKTEAVAVSILSTFIFAGGLISSIGYITYPTGGFSSVFVVGLFVTIGTVCGLIFGLIILLIITFLDEKIFTEAS